MSATLSERKAFLLALFDKNDMTHGSYISEKVKLALADGVSADMLRGALDTGNQERYDANLGRAYSER
jgi:hypothetical protein